MPLVIQLLSHDVDVDGICGTVEVVVMIINVGRRSTVGMIGVRRAQTNETVPFELSSALCLQHSNPGYLLLRMAFARTPTARTRQRGSDS